MRFISEDLSGGIFLYCRSCFLLFQYLPASYAVTLVWKMDSSGAYIYPLLWALEVSKHSMLAVRYSFFIIHYHKPLQ